MTIKILSVAAFFVLALAPVWAQDADMDGRIAELRVMSASERQAALQAMSPQERKTLWFHVRKMNQAERGNAQPADGFYRNAVQLQKHSGGEPSATASAPAGQRAVGTITYDDGVGPTIFGGGAWVGNRFDTHTGVPVLASGTVDTVMAVLRPGAGAAATDSAFFAVYGQQTAGGGATAIFNTAITGLTGATATVTFTGIGANYAGDSFFVMFDDANTVYIPAFGTGTTDGQGHHGLVGYTGGQAPNFTSTFNFGNTLNGLVRASGNILPVELIEYGVE